MRLLRIFAARVPAMPSSVAADQSARWHDRHPGWLIDQSEPPWCRLLDPDGDQQAIETDLATMVTRLVKAGMLTATDDEEMALAL